MRMSVSFQMTAMAVASTIVDLQKLQKFLTDNPGVFADDSDDDGDDEHGDPNQSSMFPVVNGVSVDNDGIPWDERIHAGTKGKNADGRWKKRKGVQEVTYNKVMEELKAAMRAAPAPTVAQAAAPVTPAAPVAPVAQVTPAPAPAPAAPTPAPAPAAPVAQVTPAPAPAPSVSFPEVVQRVTSRYPSKEQVDSLLNQQFQVPNLNALATRPDLFESVLQYFGA